MHPHWIHTAVIYHIYPLGLCDAPERNDFTSPPEARLNRIYEWLDHIQQLGANTLYLGPVFESTTHGYDTANYRLVDRRLGDNATLQHLAQTLKERGMRLILDGVFHHVGRDFWAFRDLQQHGPNSPYRDWFQNIDFSKHSPYNDPFMYEGWAGHYDLVKLNLSNPAVREYLFDTIRCWVETFDIDGLRLDAADSIQFEFYSELHRFCDSLKPDFWLMGEVVHGDYRKWANESMLDATTNYECYKGLYSSHVDTNYFEIAYSLNRQFGAGGLYRGLMLYNFADNHDVDRVASSLTNPAHLYTLYGLLFTMPGVPSIYYGSEWGISGKRTKHCDAMLRPALTIHRHDQFPHPKLSAAITRFAAARREHPALRCGDYRQLFITHEQFAFQRQTSEETLIIALNASSEMASVHLSDLPGSEMVDVLNDGEIFSVTGGAVNIPVYPHWLRILQVQ